MNGAPRKRHYYAEPGNPPPFAAPSYTKKARPFLSPPPTARVTTSSKRSHRVDGFERETVATPESEEIEEDEEVANRVAQVLHQSVAIDEVDELVGDEVDDGLEDGPMPLVVFQCSTCRSIFGDSYAFVSSTEQLWLVTLSHVTNVALNQEVQTAGTGLDNGSSYYELLCQNCQAVLGRKYLTTPVALDGIRDLFSFSTEAITSYTLGDPMQSGEAGVVPAMSHAVAACQTTMLKLAADRSEVVRLREEMEKVKGLMVTVDDRLACLEGEPESEEETTRRQKLPPSA
uniref:Mis18 domain-containing protein n=1 Tax=Peronospora matthiolae TaxID=2874970 RepID=A0AAV1UN48_9STRA